MDKFKEFLISFKKIIPDIGLLLVGAFAHLLFILFSPIFHIIGQLKLKQFPEPKTIIITGASSGIGRELALLYAAKGKFLALTGRNQERLNEVAKQCRAKGATVETTTIGVTNRSELEQWIDMIDKKSNVDVVIANAAVSEPSAPNDLSYEEKVRYLTDTNVYGVLNTILPLLQRFRDRHHGQIVVVGSLSTYVTHIFPAYVGSKSWCHGWTNTLRQELAPYGIGVTYIAPGMVDTHMSDVLGDMKKPMMKSPRDSAIIFKDAISENAPWVTDNTPTHYLVYLLNTVPLRLKDGYQVLTNYGYPDGNKMQDPYYFGQSNIQQSIKGLQALHQRWQALLDTNTFKNEEFRWSQNELKRILNDVEADINDLMDSILVVEKFPDRFNIDMMEIEKRKRFIRESRAAVDDVKRDMSSQQVTAKIERDKQNELLNTERRQNMQRESKYSGINRAYEEDTNEFLRENMQIQQEYFNNQDQELEELAQGVAIIGEMGHAMKNEAEIQGNILDRLGDRAAKSQGALGGVMRRLDKLMEATSSKVQWLMIGILAAIFVILVVISLTILKKK
ncbi:putative syntaxin 10 [Heterostelium album PN500]|uniref:Putative syntaxin 10 n=1 Tax=Heterostelium pallidum (strain ATCC 26659 / Pp 5 / PN500) TaxID=670386 RepID=D3BBH7_HETP5|nr:putative syntaxin 10 [Heterostelium album PN500]EFA81010.1 putative syntaxin 10 [Heterostelium album PN500]|eukprot:XP_020433128.1 putative syntaxin 10 [Heterostelium album PN500]